MDYFKFNWFIIQSMNTFTAIMITICLYFTLTYFDYLKQDDKRLVKQTKLFAVISLFLAFAVPAIYQLIINSLAMQ